MGRIKVETDTKKFRKWLKKADEGIAKELKDTLISYTASIEDLSKQLCPVDTGYLRGSISKEIQKSGYVGIVRVGAYYARYVEFGTYFQNPQPFLMPAYNILSKQFVDEIIKKVNKYLD